MTLGISVTDTPSANASWFSPRSSDVSAVCLDPAAPPPIAELVGAVGDASAWCIGGMPMLMATPGKADIMAWIVWGVMAMPAIPAIPAIAFMACI